MPNDRYETQDPWTSLGGQVRRVWGQMIEAELAKIAGHRDALFEVVGPNPGDAEDALQLDVAESQPGLH